MVSGYRRPHKRNKHPVLGGPGYLELAPLKGVGVSSKGLRGSFWADIGQVESWNKHRDVKVRST